MPNLCPGEYPLNSSKPLALYPNDSVPNLKYINTSTPVDIRLLACVHVKPFECKQHSNSNSGAKKLCDLASSLLYAHIYFREKLARADIKHHLIVFVKGSINVSSVKVRLEKTLRFLEINDEKTFFHIVNYPPLVSGMVVNKPNVCKNEQIKCNDELKKCFNYGYKETEPICRIYSASIGKDYSIKFSGSNPIILALE
jgi:hypothetical protein